MTQKQIDQIIKSVEWMLVDYEHLNTMGRPLAANWTNRVRAVNKAISDLKLAHARYAQKELAGDFQTTRLIAAHALIKEGRADEALPMLERAIKCAREQAANEDRESQLEVHLTSAMKMIDWFYRQDVFGAAVSDGCYHIHGKPAFNQARAVEALDMKSVHETDAEYAGGEQHAGPCKCAEHETTGWTAFPVCNICNRVVCGVDGYTGSGAAVRDDLGVHMLDLPCKTGAHPAPAVPDKLDEYTKPDAWNSGYAAGWNDCRKAMLAALEENK